MEHMPFVKRNNYLCTGKDDLARDEDKKHDLRLDHAINKTREQLKTS